MSQARTEATVLISSLQLLDPVLQFLTRASGRPLITLKSLRSTLPGPKAQQALACVPELARRGILSVKRSEGDGRKDRGDCSTNDIEELSGAFFEAAGTDDSAVLVGFPAPPGHFGGGDGVKDVDDNRGTKTAKARSSAGVSLHGSTKAAGKRRLSALRRSLKADVTKEKAGSASKGGKPRKKRKTAALASDEVKRVQIGEQNSAREKLQRCKATIDADKREENNETAESNEVASLTSTYASNLEEFSSETDISSQSCYSEQHDRSGTVIQTGGVNNKDHSEEEVRIALESLGQMFNVGKSMGSSSFTTDGEVQQSGHEDEANVDDPSARGPSRGGDKDHMNTESDLFVLPDQAAYAGSHPARKIRYGYLSAESRRRIPKALVDAMGLDLDEESNGGSHGQRENSFTTGRRKLYIHQSEAVESILKGQHTLICTCTGSGKSLCFLLPILADVMSADMDTAIDTPTEENIASDSSFAANNEQLMCTNGCAALIMFPTKALAQDQMSKLRTLVDSNPALQRHIRPGVIDGDTPHPDRATIAQTCNVILTNPDTLHAAILPGWKKIYRGLLAKVRYVVIDESHMYEGAFGAHVALVLSRLVRLCAVALHTSEVSLHGIPKKQVFVACSATVGHPEEHLRLLCPLGQSEQVRVLTADDDGSPSSPKHFFVWNPCILDIDGNSTGRVMPPRGGKAGKSQPEPKRQESKRSVAKDAASNFGNAFDRSSENEVGDKQSSLTRRRHAADETARLLAEAVKRGIKCIAFCKTRSLVEWVFERCITYLRADSEASHLASRIESYRGGYSAEARRSIEARLFCNQLLGVVGTSALELGIDIGEVYLTLHCGYPGSISSVMQQSGRGGRGGKTDAPSIAIMICFASPTEQHLWRHPKCLLSRGLCAPPSVPLYTGIVQGHMLCGAEEFPLMGDKTVLELIYGTISSRENDIELLLSDHELFGSRHVYLEVLGKLQEKGLLCESKASLGQSNHVVGKDGEVSIFSTHPSVDKPWTRVSMRSIEPISYSIVDIDHPLQGGKTDCINERAVMDTIPYSRVFYHAYPGAVIMHRGKRYKVQKMSAPPPFADCTIGYMSRQSATLGAFAQRTSVRYSTRALSLTHITVVKQFERVELLIPKRAKAVQDDGGNEDNSAAKVGATASDNTKRETEALYKSPELHLGSIAGNGVVTVKRTVHGYKKLSPINRTELSRSELNMPSMEFDTNAIWFDVEASLLDPVIKDYDAGVHALSHALLAVAPLFVPCTSSDLDCDHTRKECTRVLLFDLRAGGAGTTAQLWKYFFRPDGVLSAAIELLKYCSTCSDDSGFKGGCPGCLQSVPCMNFHEDLSRNAGLYIARRLLRRLEQSDLYKQSCAAIVQSPTPSTPEKSKAKPDSITPRRRARQRALHFAKDLESARNRNVVVGRPTWPLDEAAS